jgi:hypothetical protein
MQRSGKSLLESLKYIEDEITSTLSELASIKLSMDKEEEDKTSRVFKFIVNLKKSGLSQEFNTSEAIQKHFGVSKERSDKYLFEYIEQYSEIVPSESPVTETCIQGEIKKRKGPKPYSEMTPEELAEAKAKKLVKKTTVTTNTSETSESSEACEALATVSTVSEDATKPLLTTVTSVTTVTTVPEEVHEKPQQRRVIKLKKSNSDGIKIWNSFLKIVKADLEKNGPQLNYEDLVKKAKEMKDADKDAYALFSSNWTPDDDSSSNNF